MKRRKYVILVVVLAAIVIIWIFNITLKNDKDIYISLFTYIVSPETYDGYMESEEFDEWYGKFMRELETKCNYNAENVNFILNRQWLYYYEALEIKEIISVKNINIEFIESIESNKKIGESILNKYKVSYTYLDKKNKEYNLSDTYLITKRDNQIVNFWIQPEAMTSEMKGILSMQK